MSSALLLTFDQLASNPAERMPTAIDPLAVASVEPGIIKAWGARVIMDSGTIFILKDEYELVVRAVNDARTEYAQARRRQP
jgi:hypothetical protein